MKFGDVLRELLEEREITQKQLAKDLNIAPSTLGNYIRNIREPDFEILKTFASYFEVSTDYLLNYSPEYKKSLTQEEQTLLHIFQALTTQQQEIYTEQGKAFIKQNQKNKKNLIILYNRKTPANCHKNSPLSHSIK